MAAPVLLLAALGYVYLSDRYSVDPSGPTPQPTVSPLHAEDPPVAAKAPQDLSDICTDIKYSADAYYGTAQRLILKREMEIRELSSEFGDYYRGPGSVDLDPHDSFVRSRLAMARDHLRFGETRKAVTWLQEALEAGGPGRLNG